MKIRKLLIILCSYANAGPINGLACAPHTAKAEILVVAISASCKVLALAGCFPQFEIPLRRFIIFFCKRNYESYRD